MSSSISVESNDSGAIALPARLLLETLKTFPEQPLTFVKTDKHTVEISANNGKYAVAYVEGEDFPKAAQVKDPTNTKIIGDVLATAINATLFASGNDDLRPVMSGVFFQFSTTDLTFVATDAHKLVKYSRKDLAADSNADFIMPKKPLQLLKVILQGVEEDVVIEYNETNAELQQPPCKLLLLSLTTDPERECMHHFPNIPTHVGIPPMGYIYIYIYIYI